MDPPDGAPAERSVEQPSPGIPSIRVVDGDWGGSRPADVLAVVRSVAECFPAMEGVAPGGIVVEPTASPEDPPIVLFAPNEAGELVVRLSARANQWARMAYQFAHEYCHVIADPTTMRPSRFQWLEESLCEAASLFALRTMAVRWRDDPPYANWREYAPALDRYVDERLSDPRRGLPPGTTFGTWLEEALPLLVEDAWNREANTIVARELLPVFLAGFASWGCVSRLHSASLEPSGSLPRFLAGWAERCDSRDRAAVRALAHLLPTTISAP